MSAGNFVNIVPMFTRDLHDPNLIGPTWSVVAQAQPCLSHKLQALPCDGQLNFRPGPLLVKNFTKIEQDLM